MRLTWYGHSCFLLETGAHRLVFDPFLTNNPVAPIRAADVTCDYILCSHAHDDHIGDAIELAGRNHATIIASYELAEHFSSQGATTVDLMPGGGADLPFGRVKLTPAVHSSSLELGGGKTVGMGTAAGFIVSAENKRIYHAGDTALFLDMQLIGAAGLDLALVPIGDWYTMGIADAVTSLGFLKPKLAIPMHYNTHDKIRVDPKRFITQAAEAGHQVQVLAPGESITL
jgi:L-ascorbate metabolism protein UlaG (beta-lactamase superfamily)